MNQLEFPEPIVFGQTFNSPQNPNPVCASVSSAELGANAKPTPLGSQQPNRFAVAAAHRRYTADFFVSIRGWAARLRCVEQIPHCA